MHADRKKFLSEKLVIAERGVYQVELMLDNIEYLIEYLQIRSKICRAEFQKRRLVLLACRLENFNRTFEDLKAEAKGKVIVSGRLCMISGLMKYLRPEKAGRIDRALKGEK